MIFDCHVHLPSPGLKFTWEWEPLTPDIPAAVRYMKKCGIDLILANSVRGEIARTPQEMIAANDEIAQAARDFPDYIVPACLINTNFPEESLRELERCRKELNIAWIGELCGYAGGYTYDTEAFGKAISLAAKLDMVVHLHSSDADMERLCKEFPTATFVLAHLGDNPRETRQRIGLTAQYPNLYLDICGNGFQRMGVLENAINTAGPDRVLFGSDFTINDPAGVIARIQVANFDEQTRAKVLGGNLSRLLRQRGAKIPAQA